MIRSGLMLLIALLMISSANTWGQDNPPQNEPKSPAKEEPSVKYKGVLPPNWGKLGLTEAQRQEIYKIQAKYNKEIDALEAKIKELKAARAKEERAVLTPEQKKRLEELLLGKDK
jgi:Spy/CpxP family protein refolding chaperone